MLNSVAIDLTNHCNFDCVHCLRDKKSPRMHMEADLMASILDAISSVGIGNVCLTGGEPALYPGLSRVFDLIADHGMGFSLVSNAFLFEEKIRPLLTARIKPHLVGICFSLDGANVESHDMIRMKGSFERVIKAIEVCAAENIPVSVKSIVHRKNMSGIVDVAHLCSAKGVANLGYVLLTPTPRLVAGNLMPSAEDYENIIRHIKGRLTPSFAMDIGIEGYADREYRVSFCNPAQGIALDHLGNFIFCCNLSHPTNGDRPDILGWECLGNIGDIGIEEGILRHYRMMAWFMDKAIRADPRKGGPVNCTECFRLFGKLAWMDEHEGPHDRNR